MAPERFVDPAVGQALEEVREALRTEQASQGSLASQNAQLRERAQRLEAERDRLRGELEQLRQGRIGPMPRLPEVLVPPFELQSPLSLRRQVREALPMLLIMVLAALAGGGGGKQKLLAGIFFVFALVMVVVQAVSYWQSRERWRFEEGGIRAWEAEEPGVRGLNLIRYQAMLGVEAHSSNSQRLRGLGSVTVTYKSEAEEQKQLVLEDVPEPERLAEWLEARRLGAGEEAARRAPEQGIG